MKDDGVVVKCMDHISGKNKMRWPSKDDIHAYTIDQILYKLTKPVIPTNSRGYFKMDDAEYAVVSKKFQNN